MTFDHRLVIHRGGREIHLLFLGRAHTAGDVVAYIPSERVVATGDLMHGLLPYMGDGFPDEWPATLRALEALEFDRVIPGHGSIQEGKSVLAQFRGYVEEITEKVSRGVEQGQTLDELKKTITADTLASLKAGDAAGRVEREMTTLFPRPDGLPGRSTTASEQHRGSLHLFQGAQGPPRDAAQVRPGAPPNSRHGEERGLSNQVKPRCLPLSTQRACRAPLTTRIVRPSDSTLFRLARLRSDTRMALRFREVRGATNKVAERASLPAGPGAAWRRFSTPNQRLRVSLQDLGQVPEPDVGIVPGRGQHPPVGRERHAGEPIARAAHLAQLRARREAHSRTAPSSPAVASSRPSGEKATGSCPRERLPIEPVPAPALQVPQPALTT